LNPYAVKAAELVKARETDRHNKRAAVIKGKRKEDKVKRTKLYNEL